jgi:hypothetical protein
MKSNFPFFAILVYKEDQKLCLQSLKAKHNTHKLDLFSRLVPRPTSFLIKSLSKKPRLCESINSN